MPIQIRVEELPKGLFLATSDQLNGLVAQGRNVAEALLPKGSLKQREAGEIMTNLASTNERYGCTTVVAA